MPIYEFYCPDCHTVFSFFTARIDLEARPDCPRCDRAALERRPSRFATLKHQDADDEQQDPLGDLDESKVGGAMESLMQEMGHLGNDEDPRAMGRMMRRFSELSGLEMGDKMEELVQRMEAGEDPESLEDEMGDSLDDEDGLDDFFKLKKTVAARRRRPAVDEELYFL